MRPRSATIQAAWIRAEGLWVVEIGDPKSSAPNVRVVNKDIDLALVEAVIKWREQEGLGV